MMLVDAKAVRMCDNFIFILIMENKIENFNSVTFFCRFYISSLVRLVNGLVRTLSVAIQLLNLKIYYSFLSHCLITLSYGSLLCFI